MPGHEACSPGPPPYAGTASRTRRCVDVVVPEDVHRVDAGFVRLHRTARLPRGFCVAGEVRYAFPPRAVADAARWLADLGEVRAVVAGAVQRGLCPIERLVEELEQGPEAGIGFAPASLAEVADGVRSAAEGQLHALIKRAGLPLPMFNPRLFVGRAFLAVPDCWWPDAGVAAEVDSRAWHLSPREWEKHARPAGADGSGGHHRAAFPAEQDPVRNGRRW